MRLYLVQHGEAFPEELDPARPLTPKGRDEAERTGRLLERLGAPVREIRHSGKLRARETAAAIAQALDPAEGVREAPGLAPNDAVAPLAEALGAERDDLMLVGHLPHLAKLASLLVAGREWPPAVSMHMGGVVCLERDDATKTWRVVYSIPPEAAAADLD